MSDYLPEGVIVNILQRLPVNSIINCMCVCKLWKSLISSQYFITTHLNFTLCNTQPHLLFRHYDLNLHKNRLTLHSSIDPFPRIHFYKALDLTFRTFFLRLLDCKEAQDKGFFAFPLDFIDLPCLHHLIIRFSTIVGSYNGILCLTNDDPDSEDLDFFVLCNPSIPKAIRLPLPNIRFDSHGLEELDVSRGFGYDPTTRDYKVVRIAYLETESKTVPVPTLVEIYTLSTGAWRYVNPPGPPGLIHDGTETVFLKGAVHWFGHIDPNGKGKEDGIFRNIIVVFDMVHEVFSKVMDVPESLERVKHLRMRVAVVDGLLALVPCSSIVFNDEVQRNSVWVMREYGVAESWTKLYDITVEEGGLVRVLGFKKNGEVIVATNYNKFVCYEPSSGTISNPHILSPTGSFYLDTFVDSLVLLDVTDGNLGNSSKGKEKIN
ncbi:F-box/kelch-repeat protein At3g23880-like [Fagus crenata]